MDKISRTRPHYIRCLKPNDANVCDEFIRSRVGDQLRYGGVLEAVKVARSGYQVRLPRADFYAKYRPLYKWAGLSPPPPHKLDKMNADNQARLCRDIALGVMTKSTSTYYGVYRDGFDVYTIHLLII